MKFYNFFLLTKWKCKKLLIGVKVKINKNVEMRVIKLASLMTLIMVRDRESNRW